MPETKTFNIALYPGDGIGVEVLDAAVKVLEALPARLNFRLKMTRFDWGTSYYQSHGTVAPENSLAQLRSFDAVLLGALGDPRVLPDYVTLAPLIQMRQQFEQYACLRPTRLFKGVRSPLANPGELDLIVVRENSEGEYVTCGGRFKIGEPDEFAVQTALHTRKGVERILRFGFNLARERRRKLTMITKSNALKFGMVLWDEILEQVKKEFPEITAERMHVDAAAMDFVRRPGRFDVVVASNLFGDILTDLAGALVGGLGLAPSANINPERKFPSMFEPVHGSAPDIAGKGIANPIAMILSAAMMLEWLGLREAAQMIRAAAEATISRGFTTPDLGGKLTTAQVAERLLDLLESPKI